MTQPDPTKVTLTFTSGHELEVTDLTAAQVAEIREAKVRRIPAHSIAYPDGRILDIDMAAVATIDSVSETTLTRQREEKEAAERADRERQAAEDAAAAEPAEDTRTVPELKAALDAAGVEYDSKAKKDDLLKLAQDNKL